MNMIEISGGSEFIYCYQFEIERWWRWIDGWYDRLLLFIIFEISKLAGQNPNYCIYTFYYYIIFEIRKLGIPPANELMAQTTHTTHYNMKLKDDVYDGWWMMDDDMIDCYYYLLFLKLVN